MYVFKKRPARGSAANGWRAIFSKSVIFPKNDPPEAAPPTDGELIFRKLSFCQKTTRRRQRRQRTESLFQTNCNLLKKRPAGGSAANERRACFQKTKTNQTKTTRRRQRRQRMESSLPRDLLSITPRPIIDYPATHYRLPRDLLSITPRPIIDYAVTYYRFPQKRKCRKCCIINSVNRMA